MTQERELKVGDSVVFHDPVGRPHNAIVTAAWSKTCLNIVYVSSDETKSDSYGRQIERATSLCHKSLVQVHGMYWRFEDEEPNPVAVAVSK